MNNEYSIDIANTVDTMDISQEQIVGTKWISVSRLFDKKIAMEFIDSDNCIYTSAYKKFPLTYTISDNKIYISSIEGSFDLRGNVLFNNELPIFKRDQTFF